MLLDQLPQRLWLVVVDDVLGQELVQAHLLLEVFKVGLFVQGYLGHVAEEPPDLDAAQLDGRVEVEGLKVLLEIVVADLPVEEEGGLSVVDSVPAGNPAAGFQISD